MIPLNGIIDRLRQREERRLRFIGLLEELDRDDPEFVAELIGERRAVAPQTPRKQGSAPHLVARQKSQDRRFKKVAAHAADWIDQSQLPDLTGLTKAQVSHILTKTHAEYFEERKHPDHGLKKQWRIKGNQP